MIRFLQNNMIDKVRWDDCIGHAQNGNLYACAWYLDIVSPGWCALVEDDYERVFPMTVSSKAGFKYIMQPYFTQQLGLFYRSLASDAKLSEFLNSIPSEYRYIDINLNTSNKILEPSTITDMTNIELDLTPEYDKLASSYQTNLKRNLKKADQNKLRIAKHVPIEEIIALFRANRGQELKHLKDIQYTLVQRIANESIHKGLGEIWGAYDEYNQLLAGVLWIVSHQKAIFLFSALSETGKKLNTMPWLIDAFIRENAGRSLTLDFEGSNNEGLARFYGSFGAKRVTYQRLLRNSLPAPFRIALKLWRLSRMHLKKNMFISKQ